MARKLKISFLEEIMKKEEKETNPNLNHSLKSQEPAETCEEYYRQINADSFKQSFKLLMDHYKPN